MWDRKSLVFSARMERAVRQACEWHSGQVRKGSDLPYISHPFGVAMILERLGFSEDVVIAALLHDVVEDTSATLENVRQAFGESVADIVAACSELKADSTGQKRPWSDRKRDYIEQLANASESARAVALADKLHNLISIEYDLSQERSVWGLFNAPRAEVLAYYRTAIDRLGHGVQLLELVSNCRDALSRVEKLP